MLGLPPDLLSKTDEELNKFMLDCEGPDAPIYRLCADILNFRSTERLVKETERLAIKTWWVAFASWMLVIATWALVVVTIYIARIGR
jgi:hypothetical protein